jgi:hypothetical protein
MDSSSLPPSLAPSLPLPTDPPVRTHGFPLTAALAYLLICGYVMRTLFVSVRLPSVVGIIFIGFLMTFFMQEQVEAARGQLQMLAFFLVLLSAGFGISKKDLRWPLILLAWGPVLCEVTGVTVIAWQMLGFHPMQALILGAVAAPLGDGIVIPKMAEMGAAFPHSPLPRIIFVWASLESVLILPLFGVFEGLATPKGQDSEGHGGIGVLGLAAALQISLTVVLGALLGLGAAWFLPRRTGLLIRGRQIFNGSAVEAYLIVLGVALFAFSLGDLNTDGTCFVPLKITAQCAVNPELGTIVVGIAFAGAIDDAILSGVQTALAGTWVFGQIVLFSMLGSRAYDYSPFVQLPRILPIMGAGFVCRCAACPP